MKLHRCDVCFDLIDPAEDDGRTELTVSLDWPDEMDVSASIDLCDGCSPSGIGSFVDWLTYEIEGDVNDVE